jgi:hypothetical protein
MKTLIENSILVKGTNKGSQAKTIFNSTETGSAKYYDISKLSGKAAMVDYSYTEDAATKRGSLYISVPESLDELAVKQHIISAINDFLSNPTETPSIF